jgi:hypothetical protein
MFHSTLMRKAGAAHDERPGTPGYYAFTTGFDAAGVEHVFLQQPPATADLARSLRLIFCISKYLLSGYQIRPRTKPRFVELREYYHRDLFRGDYLRFFTLLLYIHQDFSAIIIFSISREHRRPQIHRNPLPHGAIHALYPSGHLVAGTIHTFSRPG